MSLKLTFRITIQSDYHVGAGYGQGFGVDSALLREADERPTLRGSMLAGLLRDGADRLLKLPPLQKHDAATEISRLFGSPQQAKRWQIASAHPVKANTPTLAETQTAQRARIDPRSRRAEPRKLFSQEEGRAGLVFEFTITCAEHDEAALDEAALLVAAARYVRQLGRARRRGLGECLFTLTSVEGINQTTDDWQKWFLKRFEQRWLHGVPTPANAAPQKAEVAAIATPTTGNGVRVRVIVRLDEPLLIAQHAPSGNQYDAQNFIPGSVILGALASQAAKRNDLSQPATYADFITLFRRGAVCAPVLYPADEHENNLYPAIPAPLGLLTCSVHPFGGEKKDHELHWAKDHERCPTCDARLEAVDKFMVLRATTKKRTLSPKTVAELHIEVNPQSGRVKPNQLYGYTALSVGQYFVGELLCADEDTWTRLQRMTGVAEKQPLVWRLGKARRRGYGQVTAWLERCDDQQATWVQLALEERVTEPQTLSLTLLTDTILQNAWGQQATGFEASWLEPALGLGQIKITHAYARTRTVDTFNATLGLPRWRDTALLAGSVAYLELQSPPADWQERLRRLETAGIGLRRNEGFGRLAFNHPIYDKRDALKYSEIELPEPLQQPRSKIPNPLTDWEKSWKQNLSEKLKSPFIAIARWLHACNHLKPEHLAQQIETFGEPNQALKTNIGDYGDRSKENFFCTDGKKARDNIRQALINLQKEQPDYWPQGIDLLAEHILSRVDKSKGSAQ